MVASLSVIMRPESSSAELFHTQLCSDRRYLPPETQVVLVSATLPHDVLEMTSKFMTDPVRVLVKRDELTLEVRCRS